MRQKIRNNMEMPPVKETADKQFFSAVRPCKTAKVPVSSFMFATDIYIVQPKIGFSNQVEGLFNKIDSKAENYGILAKSSRHILKSKVASILNEFHTLNIGNVKCEATWDGSILFKFSQNKVNYYFEYFVEHKTEGVDEVVLTGLKDGQMVVDFSGYLVEAYRLLKSKTNQFINQSSIINASLLSSNPVTETAVSLY